MTLKLKSLPKELFAEVIDYLADYESLEGLAQVLEGDHTILDVRSALRELALHIRKELGAEKDEKSLLEYRKDERLSPLVRELLSVLSPGDERRLLERFGFLEN
jgi:hypothetical protein